VIGVKRRSTSLFIDPLLIEVKLRFMNSERLLDISEILASCCRDEMLSNMKLEQAIDYWNQLAQR
jgi:hypothetical protein